MDEVSIRVPSLAALFDAWSVEPIERRPLSDEARQRIVDRWSEVPTGVGGASVLLLLLPSTEQTEGLERAIIAGLRHDFETMRVDARHHWIRRSLAPREIRIGVLVFFAALLAAGALDFGHSEGSLATLLSQTFVVLAWVALWGPAYRLMTGASFRLARSYFEELAAAEITIRWD